MYKIKVESCYGGNNQYTFRLTMPDGSRESIRGDKWTRKVASEALDIAESIYHMNRSAVRFEHR